MIISHLFLPNNQDTTLANIATAMNECGRGNGGWGVGYKMCWHGGVHLIAPTAEEPVRVIADGVLVYKRTPTAITDQTDHPLRYFHGWTDDGCVVIKHTTDIGTGVNATGITFYSIYMHLNAIDSTFNGIAVGGRVWRKTAIGTAGKIYGTETSTKRIHFEMVCDEANLKKIVGRTTGQLDLTQNGRADVVYGDIHFYINLGTPIYSSVPRDTWLGGDDLATAQANLPTQRRTHTGVIASNQTGIDLDKIATTYFCTKQELRDWNSLPNNTHSISVGQTIFIDPPIPQVSETVEDLVVTMHLEAGRCTMTTFHAIPASSDNWQLIGTGENAGIPEANYEYNLFDKATELSEKYSNANPAPPASAIYAQLRFGRVLPGDDILGVRVAHWRRIRTTENQQCFIDLSNTNRVKVFSDADFPHFKGWSLIDDDYQDRDCRTESQILQSWMEDATNLDERRSQLERPDVAAKINKSFLRIPAEWDNGTTEDRWGWLKSEPPIPEIPEPLTDTEFEIFSQHVEALSFWSEVQLPFLDSADCWHIPPKAFIEHMRKCGWLSTEEFAQCIPRKNKHLVETVFQIQVVANWETALSRARTWGIHLNKTMRKYLINSTKQRMLHFLSQVTEESGYLRLVIEGNGGNAPYYGRGLIQLTYLANYRSYGKYRSFIHTISATSNSTFSELGWSPTVLIATDNTNYNADNCADTAGFYWSGKARKGIELSDRGIKLRNR